MSCGKKEWVFNIATTTLSRAKGRSVQSDHLGQVLSGRVKTAASEEGDLSEEDDGYLSDDGDTNGCG